MLKYASWTLTAWLFLVGLNPTLGLAQVITGTIEGVVQDESGAVLPGVTVTAKNVETGVTSVAVTNGEGRYRLSNLVLGTYRVDAELEGFRSAAQTGLSLTVGQIARVDFGLSVGSLEETVEVTSAAPLVDTSRSQLSNLVEQKQIAELPLNSRSYTDLALLSPGVMTTSRNAEFSGTSGGGIKLSISGARPTNTGFYVDGLDTKDAFGRTPGSAAGALLGVDTVREFEVLTSSFSAQYGGSGGVINAVTKSGTNTLHGNAFWFVRDDSLDARNFFARGETPPFRRDQAGFTVGGPIKRDRTFFFIGYEKLRERRNAPATILVPGADLRAGRTPTGQVAVHPLSAQIMAAMPLPNGIIRSDGIGEYSYLDNRPADEDYLMVKVNQQLGDKDTLFVRFTYDDASNSTPLPFPEFSVSAATTGKFVISEWSRIISPTLLNTVRFSVNSSNVLMVNESDGVDASLSFIPGKVAANLVVPGLSAWGNRGFDDRGWWLTSYQTSERLTWSRGRSSLVGGFDWLATSLVGYSASRLNGRLQFASLNSFLLGQPRTWEFLVPETGSDPVPKGEARTFRQDQITFYVQDDVRLRSNLTLNMGVRWEFVNDAREKEGRISNLLDPLDPEATVGEFSRPEKANFGPRVGAAWDPRGDGKMSLRGGFGVFYQPLNYATWQIGAVQNPPFFIRAAITNPTYPPQSVFDPNNVPPSTPAPIEHFPKTPVYMQFNATVQRQLPWDIVASVAYAGSKGRNLASTENGNPFTYTVLADGTKFWGTSGAQVRVNPNFGVTEFRNFDLQSDYHSMQVSLSKRYGAGLALQGAYTLSKNEDNGSETQGTAVMDPTDPMLDYGPSTYDVRHNVSFNFVYMLPFFQEKGGAIEAALGNWQLSGLLIAQSGTPLNVIEGFNRSRDGNRLSVSQNNDRPNLVPGADPNPVIGDGRDPLRYADVSSFALQAAGTHGNLGRNTLIGPGLMQLDVSLTKSIPLGGDRRLEIRLAYFNLLNRVNFGSPNTQAFTSATGPNLSFGRITTTSTSARQGQFALKFVF